MGPVIVDAAWYSEGVRTLATDSIAKLAAERGGGFGWLGLRMPSDAELDEVRDAFDLPELAISDARETHDRPKVERHDECPLIVVPTARYVDERDVEGRGSGNSRNGSYPKTVTTEIGTVDLRVPRDREASFDPVTVRKGQREGGPPASAGRRARLTAAPTDVLVDGDAPVVPKSVGEDRGHETVRQPWTASSSNRSLAPPAATARHRNEER